MNTKKILAAGASALMIAAALAGCTDNKPADTGSSASSGGTAAGGLKTGLAVITSIESSKDAGDADGAAQADSTIVAVTVDADGKIVDCVIDAAQTKVAITKDGKIGTDKATEFKTKDELADSYGMKGKSGIGKEWYQQAAAFADYVKGKTVSEVKGIAVNESGEATGEDLKSSVTISVGGFIAGIGKAVSNAQNLGAQSGDKLGLGVTTNIDDSKDATASEAGLAQVYSTYTAATFGSDGKITSCVIDASQTNINFDAAGKITTDKSSEFKTKDELGDAYGMKGKSGLGKEWNEEAAAFASYVKGKTADEVKGIAVNEDGETTDADLKTSVTIGIGDFMTVISKASASAK